MEIQNFRNAEFGSLRVIQNEKGEMMFCLADVCKALGIGNPSQMKTRLYGDDLITSEVVTNTVNQYGECSKRYKMTFIGEPNLYLCIFQSKKEGRRDSRTGCLAIKNCPPAERCFLIFNS